MRYLSFLPICLIIFSCGSETEEETSTENELTEINSEDTASIDEIYEPEDLVERDYDLAEMPTKWILLETDEGGSFVHFDYWYSQGEGIEFEADKGDDWYINIYHEQDTEIARLSNFNATITEGDGISLVKGEFLYTDGWDKERHEVTFEWDQMWQRVAEFQGLDIGAYFIPEDDLHLFETIVIDRKEDEEI